MDFVANVECASKSEPRSLAYARTQLVVERRQRSAAHQVATLSATLTRSVVRWLKGGRDCDACRSRATDTTQSDRVFRVLKSLATFFVLIFLRRSLTTRQSAHNSHNNNLTSTKYAM